MARERQDQRELALARKRETVTEVRDQYASVQSRRMAVLEQHQQ